MSDRELLPELLIIRDRMKSVLNELGEEMDVFVGVNLASALDEIEEAIERVQGEPGG